MHIHMTNVNHEVQLHCATSENECMFVSGNTDEAHIRARAPMKTFMHVQNLELSACTPLVLGIFWPRKIVNFSAPGMNAGVRPKHERIRTNTFTYVQVLDVHGKY